MLGFVKKMKKVIKEPTFVRLKIINFSVKLYREA